MGIAPELLIGGKFEDQRGKLLFCNDFNMDCIKRFYLVENSDTKIIRAWQGHKIESKWMMAVEGNFIVAVVKPDNWNNPSLNLSVTTFELNADNPQILYIPKGLINGLRATTQHAKLMVYSDLTIEEAAKDMYRFDQNLWYDFN